MLSKKKAKERKKTVQKFQKEISGNLLRVLLKIFFNLIKVINLDLINTKNGNQYIEGVVYEMKTKNILLTIYINLNKLSIILFPINRCPLSYHLRQTVFSPFNVQHTLFLYRILSEFKWFWISFYCVFTVFYLARNEKLSAKFQKNLKCRKIFSRF